MSLRGWNTAQSMAMMHTEVTDMARHLASYHVHTFHVRRMRTCTRILISAHQLPRRSAGVYMMDRENRVNCCSMCDFQCFDHRLLLKHTKSAHENDPRFLVYCSICGKSMKKWSSLKKHLQRAHKSTFSHVVYRIFCCVTWL